MDTEQVDNPKQNNRRGNS